MLWVMALRAPLAIRAIWLLNVSNSFSLQGVIQGILCGTVLAIRSVVPAVWALDI
jgi:hypothetical protein